MKNRHNSIDFRRKQKGSIVSWFLFLAIVGLTLIVGLVSAELLLRWVSLSRVQNAANEAALVYARDMIRLRDQALSLQNTGAISFLQAGVPFECNSQGTNGCTELIGSLAQIPGAANLEYVNASQVLLYNLWGERIDDPAKVDDVSQNQCHKPHNESRFNKIPSSTPNNCDVNYKITSPIMSLRWAFRANPYGTGICCPAPGNNDNKDFCVDVEVSGRMDPVVAGGLPFLSGQGVFSNMNPVEFITEGGFEIHSRAVVLSMDAAQGTADSDGIAPNLSGETINLESIPSGTCAAAPQALALPIQQTSPLSNSSSQMPISSTNSLLDESIDDLELPLDEVVPLTDPPYSPPTELTPDCPANYILGTVFSSSGSSVSYECKPPCAVPTPETFNVGDLSASCVNTMLMYLNTHGYSQFMTECADWGPEDERSFDECGFDDGGVSRGNCVVHDSLGIVGENYHGACYCPIALSLEGKKIYVTKDRIVEFSMDGLHSKKHYWPQFSSNEGFLAYDFNNNSIIDNGLELFGQFTNGDEYKNGYQALSILDLDKNGYLENKELDKLVLWSDANFNGLSEREEIKKVSDLSIRRINISHGIKYESLEAGKGLIYPYIEDGVTRELANKEFLTAASYDIWLPTVIEKANDEIYTKRKKVDPSDNT
ncbi:MAG: hypothetical protein QNJ31_00765 [Candidatus Caenarcaniphilales bacterium]|nr:hypothetical protein [Candidatus Caenarcaniphilales bacterium]